MNRKPDRPHFITLEGGEGAGKSTLIQNLFDFLSNEGFSVLITREPGGTRLGDQIRQWLLRKQHEIVLDVKAELLLFLAARAQHVKEVLLPALSEDRIILCDRFHDSTIAYQGYARGLGVGPVRELCLFSSGGLQPDLTIYLDVDPQTGLQRSRDLAKEDAPAGEMDRLEAEKLEFHQMVRQAFHEIARAEPERFHIVDANQPQQKVSQQAIELLKQELAL